MSGQSTVCARRRSFIPVLCCVLAVFIENKIPSRKEVGSLVILSLGVVIAVWEGSVSGSPRGIMLCIVGTVCNAAMMSTSGRILSEKLDVLRLAFYTAPVSCIALFPFCYFHEVSQILSSARLRPRHPAVHQQAHQATLVFVAACATAQ